jgi:septation ring formation regulator EzrA
MLQVKIEPKDEKDVGEPMVVVSQEHIRTLRKENDKLREKLIKLEATQQQARMNGQKFKNLLTEYQNKVSVLTTELHNSQQAYVTLRDRIHSNVREKLAPKLNTVSIEIRTLRQNEAVLKREIADLKRQREDERVWMEALDEFVGSKRVKVDNVS